MRELKKGSLGMLLLALLRDQPSYGYELCLRMRERSEGALTFEDGAIYPLLHEFERQGLIEGYWESNGAAPDESRQAAAESPGRKGPRRRYYRLTSNGRTALGASVADWHAFSEAVARVLASPSEGLAHGR